MNESVFTKILVAKYSPKNQCSVPDGEVLVVYPRDVVPLKDHVQHHFVSSADTNRKSRFGWVIETSPFTFDDFVNRYWKKTCLSTVERKHLEVMLLSIQRVPAGSPTAATYACRGVERRRMEFTVHRVILKATE